MATIDNSSSEDKKKKQYVLSDEELTTLADLAGKNAHVKAGNCYPNLQSQMSYALRDVADLKEQILKLNEELILQSGHFAADALIKSIYDEFVTQFMDSDANLGTGEEEVTITRKELYEFAANTYYKIEASKTLRKIGNNFDSIFHVEKNIDLAKKGVLL